MSEAVERTAPLLDGQGLVVRASREDGRVRTAVRDLTGRETARGTLAGR